MVTDLDVTCDVTYDVTTRALSAYSYDVVLLCSHSKSLAHDAITVYMTIAPNTESSTLFMSYLIHLELVAELPTSCKKILVTIEHELSLVLAKCYICFEYIHVVGANC